ncbi:hypothetical protein NEOC65_001746 [Neochlamydia sp. AcF65]|nr:hypothetical protein [Neochlamydia sp. AcF65]MBS4170233.1 hypothetical protein [Neochlamydia sp. AcF95]
MTKIIARTRYLIKKHPLKKWPLPLGLFGQIFKLKNSL